MEMEMEQSIGTSLKQLKPYPNQIDKFYRINHIIETA